MTATKVMLIICSLLLVVVSGELSVERRPCSGQTAIYRCSVRAGEFRWIWNPVGSRQEVFTGVANSALTQDIISHQLIGGQEVLFNITALESSFISVVAIINEPGKLDGTRMTCAGQNETIRLPQTSLVPTALRVMRLQNNGSDLSIHPITEGDTSSGISYQLSSSDTVLPWTGPIVLTAPDDISFFHCQYNGTFAIDACIMQDDPMERNYTLLMNGTWKISRRCSPPEIFVTCDEDWSEDIMCPEMDSTTSPDSPDSTSNAPVNTSAVTVSTTLSRRTNESGGNSSPSIFVWVGIGVGVILGTILFIVVILVILLCVKNKRKKVSLEEMELNRLEDDPNEYSTLTHPTPARSTMPADAYDIINSGFTSRQPPEAPAYGILNGNAATTQDRPQNRYQDRGQGGGLNRVQDRAQDRDSDTDSHQYAKTKHFTRKSKSNDMMYSEVAMGGPDTLHPHLAIGSEVQYSRIQHGVRPEDGNLNLDSLLIQLRPVTDQYKELGVAAGLTQETIEEITSHAAVAFDGLVEVCDAWIRSLKRQDSTPTWRAVSYMLQEIGQEKLARDLLKVYTTGALPVIVDMDTVEIPKQATQSPPPPVPQRNDVDMDKEEMSPPPIPLFRPNEDQAIAVPPRPPKKGAPQPGAPAIPPKILPPKPSPNPTPEAVPSLPPKPNKKA